MARRGEEGSAGPSCLTGPGWYIPGVPQQTSEGVCFGAALTFALLTLTTAREGGRGHGSCTAARCGKEAQEQGGASQRACPTSEPVHLLTGILLQLI